MVIGAWTIGIITLFIPMLAGGETRWDDRTNAPCLEKVPGVLFVQGRKCLLDMPSFAWYQLKIVSVIGAFFLLAGGIIFGIMDNFLCLSVKADKLLADAEA